MSNLDIDKLSIEELEQLRARAKSKGLKQNINKKDRLTKVDRTGELPVSFAQKSQWFVDQAPDIGSGSNIILASRINGDLNSKVWQRSLDQILARHESLRTVFIQRKGQLQAQALDVGTSMPMQFFDLSERTDAQQALSEIIADNELQAFHLDQGPLIRCHLIRLDKHQHVFLLTVHHIICDGWSLSIFTQELNALYQGYLANSGETPPDLAVQYADFAQWQNEMLQGDLVVKQQKFWADYLDDIPVLLSLPWDRPRPKLQDFHAGYVSFTLDSELAAGLRAYCQQQGCTLFMLFISAWGALLSRLSGQSSVVIGTPTAGRVRPELEPLIGLFMNMLAIRIDAPTGITAQSLLKEARDNILHAYDHQDLPFEKVVEAIGVERSLGHLPLYQTIFSLRTNSDGDSKLALPGLTIENLSVSKSYLKADIELHCTDSSSGITGVISYALSLFDEATIERYQSYFIELLRGIISRPEQLLSEITLISEKERNWLLYEINETSQPFDRNCFLSQRFEEIAATYPDALALVYGNLRFSYRELNGAANQLAHALIRQGVGPEARVALCIEHNAAVVVGLLGILKAGGVYVPMDASYPSERLKSILENVEPYLVLADAAGKQALNAERLAENKVWTLDLTNWAFGSESRDNPQLDTLHPENLAYIIYTSGSTGKPKGVMIEHRSLTNFFMQHELRYGANVEHRILQFASFSFDASIVELTLGLTQGAVLYLLTPEQRVFSDIFVDFLLENKITHLFLVPSVVLAIIKNSRFIQVIKGVTISLVGEEAPAYLIRQLAKHNRVINEYGPTECTVLASSWLYHSEAIEGLVSLGNPLVNSQLYVLDQHRQPVPRGVIGEIYIGGEVVARGYFKREDLNQIAFLPDPFIKSQADKQIYRTGDLGYHLNNGDIVYCGRNDNQVKIRGFRIELGEIESQLRQYPQVSRCVIIAAVTKGKEKHLLAYFTTSEQEERISSQLLRDYLSERLPAYMIPTAFVQLDVLPTNSNGKLDRKALPLPSQGDYAREIYEAPKGSAEITLMKLWQKLLGIEKISRYDNFYALGGNSLLVIQLSYEARQAGIDLSVLKIIRSPILHKMAQDDLASAFSVDEALPARKTGYKLPIFFFPAGTGNIEYFYELAATIDPDYPIYGLPWLPEHAEQEPTLEAMSHRFLKMVKQIQPEGPYHFIGYCSGSVVIHALAKQLIGQNEKVGYIGFIDALWIKAHDYGLNEKRYLFSQIESQAERIELDIERYDELRSLEEKLSVEELMRLGKQWKLIPEEVDLERHRKILHQQVNYARMVDDYYAEPLDIDVYQFNASEDITERLVKIDCKSKSIFSDKSWKTRIGKYLGWEQAFSRGRIHIHKVPGDHQSIVTNQENRQVLGDMISQTLGDSGLQGKSKTEFDPLIPFVTYSDSVVPLICLPGAGNSITSLRHFISALEPGRSVYGLQPRGIELSMPPHSSFQTAAADNLKAIARITESGPIHLVGHSHGGLVALEMAHQLNLQGRKVASITLIDSQTPRLLDDAWKLTNQQAMDDFVEAIFNTLNIRPENIFWQIQHGDVLTVLASLHQLLEAHGQVPKNSTVDLLTGTFHTYLAARRWTYTSPPAYPQNLHIVLASETSPRVLKTDKKPVDLGLAWQKEIEGIQLDRINGNHYSMLSEINGPELARWWQKNVAKKE
ncbi:non-ribosomal peptide synthetase [Xenorhabdus bovienii]|uniref:non-ribosomal peptide synthetase n=1 Tax=Xenorhabdus bovienii TaxID=40576 RepID=UPI00237C9A7F|nr:non-ribosomal peptide synthetase [Xenorhabdus bovienii]MDE1475330.1 amino acid adenylation domain-containing protein [Xenorhabdus bovienii]MDE9430552.1 amino acid adenylation domain-containing protein [Xenorhabdus bovienii]